MAAASEPEEAKPTAFVALFQIALGSFCFLEATVGRSELCWAFNHGSSASQGS